MCHDKAPLQSFQQCINVICALCDLRYKHDFEVISYVMPTCIISGLINVFKKLLFVRYFLLIHRHGWYSFVPTSYCDTCVSSRLAFIPGSTSSFIYIIIYYTPMATIWCV